MTKKNKEGIDLQPFRQNLLKWYDINYRKLPWRETSDPYKIWISEVMLQQTQVSTVLDYYRKFLHEFPTVSDLAKADLQRVLKVWEKLGYYARARNLHKAAGIVHRQFADQVPPDYQQFLSLPGAGKYISAAVMSIAFNQPHAVLDGNVKRVIARLYLIDDPVNRPSSQKTFQEKSDMLLNEEHPGLHNQAMMELGATVCLPRNPKCDECPVAEFCLANQQNLQQSYPVRVKKKKAPQYHIVVGVIEKNSRVLITRRKENGLLGGLWEFPGGKIQPGEAAETACLREIKEEVNLKIEIQRKLTTVKHAYTHFKIVMDVFLCRYINGRVKLNGPADFKWIRPQNIDDYPFPGANHKFFPLLKQTIIRE